MEFLACSPFGQAARRVWLAGLSVVTVLLDVSFYRLLHLFSVLRIRRAQVKVGLRLERRYSQR